MDQDTTLRRGVRLIAGAIEDYAKVEKWSQDDFRWYYRVQPEVNHIHLIIMMKNLLQQDYHTIYLKITSFLRDKLEDEAGLFDSLGVALWDFEQVREGSFYSVGSGYQDYRDDWAYRPVHAEN